MSATARKVNVAETRKIGENKVCIQTCIESRRVKRNKTKERRRLQRESRQIDTKK
jgi:hypothetical protein